MTDLFPVTVHDRLDSPDGIDLGDDDVGAGAPGPHGHSLAAHAVPGHDELEAGQKDIGGPEDAVERALPRAVAVVEEMFRLGVIDGDDGIAQHAVLGHALEPDDTGCRLFGPGQDAGKKVAPAGMGDRDKVRPVVHRDGGPVVQGLEDVPVIGLVVLPLDSEDGDLVVLDQGRGDVVLGAEGIGGAEPDVRPAEF
jgi:hypothetical protein